MLLFLEHAPYRQCWHARVNLGYVAIFSNAEKFRRLCSYYGSCMPSSPKECGHPWQGAIEKILVGVRDFLPCHAFECNFGIIEQTD